MDLLRGNTPTFRMVACVRPLVPLPFPKGLRTQIQAQAQLVPFGRMHEPRRRLGIERAMHPIRMRYVPFFQIGLCASYLRRMHITRNIALRIYDMAAFLVQNAQYVGPYLSLALAGHGNGAVGIAIERHALSHSQLQTGASFFVRVYVARFTSFQRWCNGRRIPKTQISHLGVRQNTRAPSGSFFM